MTDYEKNSHPIYGDELGFLDALQSGVSFLSKGHSIVSPLQSLFGKKKKQDKLKKYLPFLLAAKAAQPPPPPSPPPPVYANLPQPTTRETGLSGNMPLILFGGAALFLLMKK